MIYHPYQFMKPNLHELELVRYLALYDSEMSKADKRECCLFNQVVLEQYLECEINL